MNEQGKIYKFTAIAIFAVLILLLFGPFLYKAVLSSTYFWKRIWRQNIIKSQGQTTSASTKAMVSNNSELNNMLNNSKHVMNCLVPPCPQMN